MGTPLLPTNRVLPQLYFPTKRCSHVEAALGMNTGRGFCQFLQPWDGTKPNFIEKKRMETIFKTKQRIVKWGIFWIENQCLASHPPTLGYSAGQEVRDHPGRERGQSRFSYVTLGNLSLQVSQVILETGSSRSPAVCRKAELFHDDLSWHFPPKQREVIWRQSVSLWAWLGWTPQLSQIF